MKSVEIMRKSQLRKSVINILKDANNAILEIYNKTNKQIITKSNNTPLTEADLAANSIIINGLKNIFPDIPVVSEENEDSLSIPRKNDIFWLIDPLDGTKEFINHNDEFTCNVALIERNRTRLGFVGVPVKGEIYFGGKQFGANLLDQNNILSEVKYKSKDGICRVVASKSHLNEETSQFIEKINEPTQLIQAGSSLKFIKIANGFADIYPRLAPTSEWDTAAAHAILEGAGGSVTQINGSDLIYGKNDILNPFFIARGIK